MPHSHRAARKLSSTTCSALLEGAHTIALADVLLSFMRSMSMCTDTRCSDSPVDQKHSPPTDTTQCNTAKQETEREAATADNEQRSREHSS